MKIVISMAQENADMYLNFSPGALILSIVTRKFTELIVIETVMSIRAPAPRLNPMVGVNSVAVWGEYSVQPRSGAAPKKKLRIIITPLKRKNQKLIAFRRGNARSRAPICKGMMKFAKPKASGDKTQKIINSPCTVTNWL